MGRVVGFFEALNGDVGVDLRGDEVGVAEEFLDAAEIGAAIQEMGGIAMAEFVRGEFGVKSGADEILLEPGLDDTGSNGARVHAGGPENWIGTFRRRAERFPIMFDCFKGMIADGSDAFLFSFAAHTDEAFGEIEVLDTESAEFADAETAGVDGL